MISSFLESTKNFIASQLHSNEVGEGNTRLEETNDAAAARSHNLQDPRSPTAASRPYISPPIATSLLSQPHRATQLSSSSTVHRHKSHIRPSISADERRLLGDYNTPADASFCISPAEWGSSSLPMKHKSAGFKPGLNTIDCNIPLQGNDAYGSPPRSRGAGQLKFLETQNINVSGRGMTARPYDSLNSPARKRQKTTPTDMVDLVSDDEVMSVEVKSPHPRNSHFSPDRAPSMTSKSQHSHEGVHPTWTGGYSLKYMQQPVSSFQHTDNLLNSRRKKSRAGGVQPPKPRQTIKDLLPEPALTNMADLDELSQEYSQKSHHWPEQASGVARINHSTSAHGGRDGAHRATSKNNSENLRHKFRRASVDRDPIQDDQQDELQIIGEGTARRVQRRSNSPIKCEAQPSTTARRKDTTVPSRWPLLYARYTHWSPGDSELGLELSAEKVFNIVCLGSGPTATSQSIDLRKIRKAESDERSRIRLEGSRDQAGNLLLFDLEFENVEHFKVFCNSYVRPNTTNKKIFLKDQEHMEKLHRGILHVKPEIDAPIVVDDQESLLLKARTQNGRQLQGQAPPRKDLLIHKMSPGNPPPAVRETRANSGMSGTFRKEGVGSLARQSRSTRNNEIRYDHFEEEPAVREENIPYSIHPGLGKSWDKPLPYVHGKRRALVNFTDLERLDEDVFLNDSLIDFYLIYLFEQANIPANKVYFFNTMFYSTLTRNVPGDKGAINYAGVARWTAREDLFSYDHIVVPINESSHWYLAIICNVSNIPRKLDTDGPGTSSPAVHCTTESTLELSGPRDEDGLALAAASDTSGDPPMLGHGKAFQHLDEEDNKISLVDANAVETNDHLPTVTPEAVPGRTSPAAETARMEELSLSDSPATGVIKQSASASLSAKRKAKKRPLPKYDPDKSIIVILDSLGGNHSKAVRVLKDYILEEGRAKRGMEAMIEQKTFYVKSNHIPLQENFSDCGVFLLGYAQKFFADPREFLNCLLGREMDTETDWPDMNASEMRHAMRRIIQDLAEKQRTEQRQNKKATKAMKATPPPPVKTDLPAPKPQLQSPFKETPSTKTKIQSKSPRQPSPVQVEDPPTTEKIPTAPIELGLPPLKPKQQSPFEEIPLLNPDMRSKSPRQPSLVMTEMSPARKEGRHSPKVVIPMPARNSPKRQLNISVHKHDSADTGTATLVSADRVQAAVEIRSPKRQKQNHAELILSRHSSPEKPKPAPRLPRKSPGPGRKAPLAKTNHMYSAENARQSHGSLADPIPIDDSQDGTIVVSPKPKKRFASVEMTEVVSSRSPKKTRRFMPSIEKPVQSMTEDEEFYLNDNEKRPPMNNLLPESGTEAHVSRASREASLTPRRARAAQIARATEHATKKKDAAAMGLIDNEEDEVIPDSPEEKRRSPRHGRPT